MRRSLLFSTTSKTVPSDETAKNAQLLIQAGYIHKEMAGVYDYLPLGQRVIDNIKQIVREEMNRIGSQELTMSVLQPSTLWEKTDRWDDAKVDNWFKTRLTNGTQLGVGLTHEEPITAVAKRYISSYRDFPKSVYQIGDKFRNEKRAKSGILRGREFIMKDAYTFARDIDQHHKLYEQMADAYHIIYQRLGLGDVTVRVKADGGIFTDEYSDEFQTMSEIGEDVIFHVPDTDIYYNLEIAPSRAPEVTYAATEHAMEKAKTPQVTGVAQLAEFLGVSAEQITKTMLYVTDKDKVVAVAVRGDYEVNDIKLRKVLNAASVQLADVETVKKITGAEVGYAGLIGLPDSVEVIIDESCMNRVNFEMGGNDTDYHYINVNWGRDIPEPDVTYDIKEAKQGDLDPESGRKYETMKAVEVGNIFPLETRFPDALNMTYSDENGDTQKVVMGSYGIGVSRLMGIIAEHFADGKGLVWPRAVAPYTVYLVSIGQKGAVAADELYDKLQKENIEVLYDDRSERPGVKFADAELLGIPFRVTVSDRLVEAGKIEFVDRATQQEKQLTYDELLAILADT